jgi:hypothetical protein
MGKNDQDRGRRRESDLPTSYGAESVAGPPAARVQDAQVGARRPFFSVLHPVVTSSHRNTHAR